MITLQQQARALGDPTRFAIFRYIADAKRPVGVAELTSHLSLNHNAIRQHLAKLRAAELVLEQRVASGGRGRPRLAYELSAAGDSRWGTVGPYERLSLLLTEIIRTGQSPLEVGRRAGRTMRPTEPTSPADDMTAAMARQGFEPELRIRRGGADIILQNCPFATAAVDDRATICALHLGIAEGLVDGTTATVEELVVKDPRRAGCRVKLREG
jgi:predicted ArsR family transcriptional regulator